MKYNLPCKIVEDLLPNYIDELTSDESNEAVRVHLDDCKSCREKYETMAGKEFYDKSWVEDQAEIDFLKKNKKSARKKAVAAVLATAVIILGLFGVKTYMIGSICDPALIDYQLMVEGNQVEIEGTMLDGSSVVSSDFDLSQDGVLNITVKTAAPSFINSKNFSGSFAAADGKQVQEIRLNSNVIIWSDCTYVAPKVSDIYNNGQAYIGDAPGCIKLAETIGFYEILGDFTNEFETSAEPYAWTMNPTSDFDKSQEVVLKEQFMPFAVILLANIDNLDEIKCRYLACGKFKTISMSADEADRYLAKRYRESGDSGPSIKAAASAGELQKMIDALPIHGFSYSNSNKGLYLGGDLSITIDNQTNTDIYGFGLDYIVNDDAVNSMCTTNADGSALEKGEFGSASFPSETYIADPEETRISLGVSVLDKNQNSFTAVTLDLGTFNEMKETYMDKTNSGIIELTLVVTGNYESGFNAELK